jgi:NTP pyrophosphatase (non-canonical NTP hydrolase)
MKEDNMKHFNQLTPAEAERLAVLLEEMGEAQQAIGKILRHGYNSRHPAGGETNRETLERELGDVLYAMLTLCRKGDVQEESLEEWAKKKHSKIEQYLHHSE